MKRRENLDLKGFAVSLGKQWNPILLLTILMSWQAACGSHQLSQELKNELPRNATFWVTTGQDTYFKNVTRNQSDINSSKACKIDKGTRFPLTAAPLRLANAHTFVSMLELPPLCDFSSGFFYTPHIEASSSVASLEAKSGISMTVKKETWFQRGTLPEQNLERGSEKCTLYQGGKLRLQAEPVKIWKYYMITLEKFIPGCDFSLGFVAEEDVKIKRPVVDTGKDRRVKAFLDVIAYAEGTGASYNIRFGGARFYGYNDHPRTIFCSYGLCSDAAGRYQFLSTTWDSLRKQIYLPDFSPASQDKGALTLIKNRGVGDLRYIDRYQEFKYALWQLRYEWASLPDAPYGQPTKTYGELWQVYQASL